MKKQTSDVDRFIGVRVREARSALRMTQSDLGQMLDITFQQVQKYEKGVNRISSATLLDISKVLGRPLTWFYGEHILELSEAFTHEDALFRECEQLLLGLKGSEILPVVRDFLHSAVQNN